GWKRGNPHARIATGAARNERRLRRARRGPTPAARKPGTEETRPPDLLLQNDRGALLFELGLDLLRLLLRDGFLHRPGKVVDQILGLLETQAGDLADHLDDLDLLLARTLEDDVELRLLLDR